MDVECIQIRGGMSEREKVKVETQRCALYAASERILPQFVFSDAERENTEWHETKRYRVGPEMIDVQQAIAVPSSPRHHPSIRVFSAPTPRTTPFRSGRLQLATGTAEMATE
ncbi:hypothetical protein Hypma_012513 [Hypsizygus marmoreus]|uniref:Uncharacterized protein n=1 Tax=Hypsizygus marmoreus TaxID=39966 RepID=A0A369JLZ0_HYPMA|nr:hypothetical protein Hypma_012513 [Hypsizygus marmoreus]